MPRFGDAALTHDQLQSLVRYVSYLKDPERSGRQPVGAPRAARRRRGRRRSSASARWCSRFAGSGPGHERPRARARRGTTVERVAFSCFVVATLAALGLAGVYAAGGQPQAEGTLLGIALLGFGAGLILWAHALMPSGPFAEERHPLGTTPRNEKRSRMRSSATERSPAAGC